MVIEGGEKSVDERRQTVAMRIVFRCLYLDEVVNLSHQPCILVGDQRVRHVAATVLEGLEQAKMSGIRMNRHESEENE